MTEQLEATRPDAGNEARVLAPRRPLDVTVFDGLSEGAILKHYLRQVRAWRGSQTPHGFRQDDLQILIGILGTDPRTIEKRLLALTGCRPATAKLFRRLLVLGIVASAGAAVLGQGIASASKGPATQSVQGVAALAAAELPATAQVDCVVVAAVPQHPTASSASASAGGTVVSFTIPAYAEVRLNQAGKAIAVRTNTGKAPTCDDSWYVTRPQHTGAVPLQAGARVDRVMTAVDGATASHGAWTPGTWYPV